MAINDDLVRLSRGIRLEEEQDDIILRRNIRKYTIEISFLIIGLFVVYVSLFVVLRKGLNTGNEIQCAPTGTGGFQQVALTNAYKRAVQYKIRAYQPLSSLFARDKPYAREGAVPLVYVTGHSGSFDQIKGLASAYDDMLLRRGGDITPVDFYAIDFRKEKSAYHTKIIESQADYLVYAFKEILSLYSENEEQPNEIIVVAHSMGGIVFRLAMNKMPDVDFFKIAIFLNSPFVDTVLPADHSLAQLMTELNTEWRTRKIYRSKYKDLFIMSFSGGAFDTNVRTALTTVDHILLKEQRFHISTPMSIGTWRFLGHNDILNSEIFMKIIGNYINDAIGGSLQWRLKHAKKTFQSTHFESLGMIKLQSNGPTRKISENNLPPFIASDTTDAVQYHRELYNFSVDLRIWKHYQVHDLIFFTNVPINKGLVIGCKAGLKCMSLASDLLIWPAKSPYRSDYDDRFTYGEKPRISTAMMLPGEFLEDFKYIGIYYLYDKPNSYSLMEFYDQKSPMASRNLRLTLGTKKVVLGDHHNVLTQFRLKGHLNRFTAYKVTVRELGCGDVQEQARRFIPTAFHVVREIKEYLITPNVSEISPHWLIHTQEIPNQPTAYLNFILDPQCRYEITVSFQFLMMLQEFTRTYFGVLGSYAFLFEGLSFNILLIIWKITGFCTDVYLIHIGIFVIFLIPTTMIAFVFGNILGHIPNIPILRPFKFPTRGKAVVWRRVMEKQDDFMHFLLPLYFLVMTASFCGVLGFILRSLAMISVRIMDRMTENTLRSIIRINRKMSMFLNLIFIIIILFNPFITLVVMLLAGILVVYPYKYVSRRKWFSQDEDFKEKLSLVTSQFNFRIALALLALISGLANFNLFLLAFTYFPDISMTFDIFSYLCYVVIDFAIFFSFKRSVKLRARLFILITWCFSFYSWMSFLILRYPDYTMFLSGTTMLGLLGHFIGSGQGLIASSLWVNSFSALVIYISREFWNRFVNLPVGQIINS